MEKRRTSHSRNDFAKLPETFDEELAVSVRKLRDRMPTEWENVMLWLRMKAVAVPMDPVYPDAVVAEYHRKSTYVQIITKLQGFEAV